MKNKKMLSVVQVTASAFLGGRIRQVRMKVNGR